MGFAEASAVLGSARARARLLTARLTAEVRSWLGIRRGLRIAGGSGPAGEAGGAVGGGGGGGGGHEAAGLYYKELTSEPLARALSKKGSGKKDYRVTFAGGDKMIVRCSAERCYADVMGPEGLSRWTRLEPLLRPGSRVLEICGAPACTGYTSAWLARTVGESGAVLAVIADEQGAAFAARRYARPNLAFEAMDRPLREVLSGETDNSFDAVVCALPEGPGIDPQTAMAEAWRVVAPGGWIALLGRAPLDELVEQTVGRAGGGGEDARTGTDGSQPAPPHPKPPHHAPSPPIQMELLSDPTGPWHDLLVHKPIRAAVSPNGR